MNTLLLTGAVALGGAAGAVGRHLISELVRISTSWPVYTSTLIANLVGCFGIGVAFVLLEDSGRPAWLKMLLVTGLLGSFTTFSTFSLDAMHLIHDRKLGELAIYLIASVLIGLAAVKGGMVAAAC